MKLPKRVKRKSDNKKSNSSSSLTSYFGWSHIFGSKENLPYRFGGPTRSFFITNEAKDLLKLKDLGTKAKLELMEPDPVALTKTVRRFRPQSTLRPVELHADDSACRKRRRQRRKKENIPPGVLRKIRTYKTKAKEKEEKKEQIENEKKEKQMENEKKKEQKGQKRRTVEDKIRVVLEEQKKRRKKEEEKKKN